jgi:hypothetical protein
MCPAGALLLTGRRDRSAYLLLTLPAERPDEGGLKDLEMDGPENDL